MWPFKKKEKKEAQETTEEETDLADEPASSGSMQQEATPNLQIIKLTADVEKLKAQFSTFYEIQKTVGERFSRVNEQIGEVRTMMIEREKASQHLEAKATQAVDLVKTVQPDKLMIELRKMDGKIEAVRANIESSENIMGNLVNELKEVKNKVNVFRGLEQVIALNEEAKKELMDVKKIQSIVERHADKVETIFTEMQKKFSDFAKFNDLVKDLDKSFKQISSEFDSIKIKISDFSTKKELENIITKVEDFEKYAGNIIKLINTKFEKMQKEVNEDFAKKYAETEKLLKGFHTLASKVPDLDKYFNLLTEEEKKTAAAAAPPVEKLKEIGEETKEPVPEPASGGMMGKLGGLFKKK